MNFSAMKRRNFLSGLLAAPLAVKARLARLFVRKPAEPCGAPILPGFVLNTYQPSCILSLTARQREIVHLLAEGKSLKEIAGRSKIESRPPHCEPILCSLPRGHKGPHVLLNRR